MRGLAAILFCMLALNAHADLFDGFNPGAVLKGYTDNPKEAALKPVEGRDNLALQSLDVLKADETARRIREQAVSRPKVKANPNAPEMQYAEKLLDNPEEVLEGACYTQPAACSTQHTNKTCEESMQYTASGCENRLTVRINKTAQHLTRQLPLQMESDLFSLVACLPNETCTANSLAAIPAGCERIEMQASWMGNPLEVIQAPTCQNPQVQLNLSFIGRFLAPVEFHLTLSSSEDSWQTGACDGYQQNGACLLEGEYCGQPNAIKTIDGIAISRPCWSKGIRWQCAEQAQGNCDALLSQNCSQTASACTEQTQGLCTHYRQTFSCAEQVCLPEKTICKPEKMGCANGDCDESKAEESTDAAEGISRLGALAGVAADFSQTGGALGVFAGAPQACKKHPLGLRDCCKDSGWGDWVLHCPPELQELQKAKTEERVVYLGSYKNTKIGARHYVYCVFPTRLGAIIQIQGRGKQLSIGYGSPEFPDCRGVTPQELERIDFSALDLSPLEQEFMNRMQLQDLSQKTDAISTRIGGDYAKH